LKPALTALASLLKRLVVPAAGAGAGAGAVLPLDVPANCPRAHFPFPTLGRWAALGTSQLPVVWQLQRDGLDINAKGLGYRV